MLLVFAGDQFCGAFAPALTRLQALFRICEMIYVSSQRFSISGYAGSYNYNRNAQVHNWFRGSLSHNTVIVAESDHMVPHRTFKYLNWAKGFSKDLCFDNGHSAIIGVHQGYRRLLGQWCHARVIAYLDDTFVILDRLWPFEPTDSKQNYGCTGSST